MLNARPDHRTACDLAVSLGAMAALASFEELILSPKPGLVDPTDSGSHNDMSWLTFIKSASALASTWREPAFEGIVSGCLEPSGNPRLKLRMLGIEMERKMFAATGGVNTHKGLIFSLSLILAAAGACVASGNSSPGAICAEAGGIAAPLVQDDLRKIRGMASEGKSLTHGEKIFLEHGIGGIRSEALSGFPSVLSALAEMENAISLGASLKNASLAALLLLMRDAEDTNIIHRAGIEFWREAYRDRIIIARENFDPLRPGRYMPLLELNQFLISHRASPGGAADLLACALFLYHGKILYSKYAPSWVKRPDLADTEIENTYRGF
ncbi:MAG: triphosphoribosyl-dephospho-CoA synthase [Synergistaceae bacterium]|nr:triphosphoribosyl-dephospho-CoA synthase [Synergistaceae bacterium]